MTYNEFINEMEQRVQLKLGNNYSVKLVEQIKNNNSVWQGLLIRAEGNKIAPIIYLEDFFEHVSIANAADEIIKCYRSLDQPKFSLSYLDFSDFSAFEEIIFCKVINYEKNLEMLKSVPFTKFKDLAIVFYVLFDNDTYGQLTMQIKNEHLKQWNVSKQKVEKIARENTKRRYPMLFKGVGEVISSMIEEFPEEEPAEEIMFVVTNKIQTYGAVNIIYEDLLDKIALELEDSFYILPSSLHELIILPKRSGGTKETLETMVTDINEAKVEEEEQLSNTVYFYDRIEKKLI